LTRHDAAMRIALSAYVLSCRPPTKLSCATAAIVIISLIREDAEWTKYKSNKAASDVIVVTVIIVTVTWN